MTIEFALQGDEKRKMISVCCVCYDVKHINKEGETKWFGKEDPCAIEKILSEFNSEKPSKSNKVISHGYCDDCVKKLYPEFRR